MRTLLPVSAILGAIRCWWRSERLDRPGGCVGGSVSTEVAAALVGSAGE
jgi:hypothetical protein